jgi:hypothetical protein
MRAQGQSLDRWIDRNREFVFEALVSLPVVDRPCEICGVQVVRSCVKDRIVCGGCEFKERCAKGAVAARAYMFPNGMPEPPVPPARAVRVYRRRSTYVRPRFSWMRAAA